MRILYINNLFVPNILGGAEKILMMLSEGMIKRGHEVIVVNLIPPLEKPYIDYREGVKIHYIPLINSYWPFNDKKRGRIEKILWHLRDSWNIRMASEITKIVNIEEPDIVHIHNLSGFSGAVLKSIDKKYPIILTLHDYYFKCYRSTMFKNGKNCTGQCLDCRLFSLPRKAISNRVNSLVSVSDFVLNRIVSSGYFEKSSKRVINNSVPKIEVDEKRIRERKVFTLGYIGRITEEKGFNSIVNALSDISGDWRFVFAGSGDTELIKTVLDKFPTNATYLGFVKPVDFYNCIDLLIIPSLWNDPYPTVGLEALSAGIPVIGRRVGGIPEIVEKFDENFVFDSDIDLPGKINAFKFNDTNSDLEMPYSVKEIYDLEKYFSEYENTYIRLVDPND